MFSQKALVSFPRMVEVNLSGGNRLEMFEIVFLLWHSLTVLLVAQMRLGRGAEVMHLYS